MSYYLLLFDTELYINIYIWYNTKGLYGNHFYLMFHINLFILKILNSAIKPIFITLIIIFLLLQIFFNAALFFYGHSD